MAFVFRLHKGKNLKGWDNSTPLNSMAVDHIKDPNGAHVSREITSIPSPFARIDLVKTAFKEVTNIGIGSEQSTIYHKLVSDALDVGQILFNSVKYKAKIEVIGWDRTEDLERLTSSTNPQHRLLGESLRLYLDQDAETYNFGELHKIYLIHFKQGEDQLNIIGGTSPSTLFFSSANTFHLEGFQEGNDKLLDNIYKSLFERDTEYIKYIFGIRNAIPGFASKMPEFDEYLEGTYRKLDPNLKGEIDRIEGFYNNLPFLSVDGGGETVEILGESLRMAAGRQDAIADSDFVIKPSREMKQGAILPLVLPNEADNSRLTYVSAAWEPKDKAPFYDPIELDERTLPFDGSKYPYFTISDLLEPVLIRTEFPVANDYFFTGGYSSNEERPKGFLLPINPLFFDYFTVGDLKSSIDGQKVFELKPLARGYVEATLRVPIQKGQHVTFRRIYNNPVNQSQVPESDPYTNRGTIIENRINLAITPFYKFPETIQPEYNVALYDADYIFENNEFNLTYYDVSNNVIPEGNVNQVQKRFKKELTYNMFGGVINSNFEYILLSHKYAKGVMVPLFERNIGGTSSYSFSIDFGTSNTHVEYKVDGKIPQALEIRGSEKFHIGSLIAFKDFEEAYLNTLRVDFFPEEIGQGSHYKFPQRTVIGHHKNINFLRPLFSLGNISIPFNYEKEYFDLHTKIRTNLKWSGNTEENHKVLESFFEEITKIIRNKILLNGGDLDKTKIIWSYPASMLKFQLDHMKRSWDGILHKYLGGGISVERVCESLTPFFYYAEYGGLPVMEKPVVSIDIGGGTSDVAIYKEKTPVLFTSYKFAGDAIFGDNYKRNLEINGFINRYFTKIVRVLEENDQSVLLGALKGIKENGSSHDLINAFFSLKDNVSLKDENIKVDFLEYLSKDSEFKIIFLYFYVSQIYHVANLIKSKNITVPGMISFSGTASKLLNIVDADGEHLHLQRLAEETFKHVLELTERPDIKIELPKNPKELSSKGGLCIKDRANIEPDQIKETLISHSKLQQKEGSLHYNEVKQFEKQTLEDFQSFLDFFQGLNKKYSFKENFGVEVTTLEFSKELIEKRKINALKTGIDIKQEEITDSGNEPITETLFFYPLVGTLGELAYELDKRNGK